jgi:hypothetical protein
MNGENNHVFHTSALDSWPHDVQRPRLTWTLFSAQLWLLVAFVGMSLLAIAIKLFLGGPSEAQPAAAFALGLIGVVLTPTAWWNVARQLDRAERESAPADANVEVAPTRPHGRDVRAKQELLVSHR